MSDSAAQQPQQSVRQKKPPFSDFPTIKILTPPKGRHSVKTDEWCFTYCSQSVGGRINAREPYCRTFCIRKVFPHEVRNVIGVKTHRNANPNGTVKYPLPREGQPENIPKLLGGKQSDDMDEKPAGRRPEETNYWHEGWYLWTGSGRWTTIEKTGTMLMDLEQQQRMEALRDRKRKAVTATSNKISDRPGGTRSQWGYVIPPNSNPDLSAQPLLLPIPPDFPPLRERINKLLAPTYRVLSVLRESIVSGEQKQFALKIWDKACSDEPFILASRTFTRAYEQWKKNEDDRKKDST